MKRLAIIANGNEDVAKAITEYFQRKSSSPSPACLAHASQPATALSNTPLKSFASETFSDNKNVELELLTSVGSSNNFDLVACIHGGAEAPNAINLHASLLPAFDSENPVFDAFMYGAKVTGVTVHRADGRIILQYPLLIGNLTHFDDLQEKITEIEKKIYPIVIEKVLNDEVFDFDDLFGASKCSGNCGNCGGCH